MDRGVYMQRLGQLGLQQGFQSVRLNERQSIGAADVQRDAAFTGAVIMDLQLVYSEKAGHLLNDRCDRRLQRFIRPLPQKRAEISLERLDAGDEDQARHPQTDQGIDRPAGVSAHEDAD